MRGKRAIQAIVSIFETGHSHGDPSAVAILPDGAGISYGMHQGTDRSDTLDEIVVRYLDRGGSATALADYLPRLDRDETTTIDPRNPPQWVRTLVRLLQRAGEDETMRQAQEEVFDERYWEPCERICRAAGLRHPLSWAVVYDTCIQSGPGRVAKHRARFREMPPSRGGCEKAWTRAYLAERLRWLQTYQSRNPRTTELVRSTVYRPLALLELAGAGRWELRPPFRVRGVEVSP